jgi:hypothetical protein
LFHYAVGIVGVGDHVQDHQHHQGDRLTEVKRTGRGVKDALWPPQVGMEVGDWPLGSSGEQGPRVREHNGIVIHVDNAGLRSDVLRDLVGVTGRRYARADVEELPDAALADQETHGPGQEGPVHP